MAQQRWTGSGKRLYLTLGLCAPLALALPDMSPARPAAAVLDPDIARIQPAGGVLQCVPYARYVSGIQIFGDAWGWWGKAEGHYARGNRPKKGAVLAFRSSGVMPLGHVAMVSKVIDRRQVLLNHANWSYRGGIERDVLAQDVSDDNDWSAVRVWYSPNQQMGARTNPTYGFIYPGKPPKGGFEAEPGEDGFRRLDIDLAEVSGTGARAERRAEREALREAERAAHAPRLAYDRRVYAFEAGLGERGKRRSIAANLLPPGGIF